MDKSNLQVELEKGLLKFKEANYQEALNLFKNLEEEEKNFLVQWYLGHTYFRLHEYHLAIEHVKKSIQLKAEDSLNLNFLGELYIKIKEYNKAISTLEKILKINPENKNGLINLAIIYLDTGNYEKSKFYYKKLLEFDPTNYYAIYQLVKLDQNYLNEELVNKTEQLIDDNLIDDENLIFANFILAEHENRNKNYEFEIKYLIKGHDLFHNKKQKAADEEYNYYTNLLPKFIKKIKLSDFSFDNKFSPIFIMGLPRSGTTLVEQIITTGNKSYLPGEETEVFSKVFFSNRIIQNYNSQELDTKFKFNKDDFLKLRDQIINQYNHLNIKVGEENFTDKSLENIMYIELISKIFPNAKFIYCKRDKIANLLGILKVFLPNILWSHSIEKILKLMDLYDDKLKSILNDRTISLKVINLEELTANPEKISKDLFNFLDLKWSEESLLLNTKNKKIIKTLSNIQVREKIKKHDLDYLNNYLPILKKVSNLI